MSNNSFEKNYQKRLGNRYKIKTCNLVETLHTNIDITEEKHNIK